MVQEKKRYKAMIANKTYTIIGYENKQHMELVTRIVNDQLAEIKQMSPQIDDEQAAILAAVNAVSDQVKKQEQLLTLEKEVAELRKTAIKAVELENRVKRIEAIEAEARDVLKQSGQDQEINSIAEAQQILNENRKKQIQQKNKD